MLAHRRCTTVSVECALDRVVPFLPPSVYREWATSSVLSPLLVPLVNSSYAFLQVPAECQSPSLVLSLLSATVKITSPCRRKLLLPIAEDVLVDLQCCSMVVVVARLQPPPTTILLQIYLLLLVRHLLLLGLLLLLPLSQNGCSNLRLPHSRLMPPGDPAPLRQLEGPARKPRRFANPCFRGRTPAGEPPLLPFHRRRA